MQWFLFDMSCSSGEKGVVQDGGCISLCLVFFLILILLLIRTEEGEEIKIKIRSKIKRRTQKCEMHPGSVVPELFSRHARRSL
jgi:hypothetical protein